jgi:hypothetical protein
MSKPSTMASDADHAPSSARKPRAPDAPGRGSGLEHAAEECDPLAHPHQAMSAPTGDGSVAVAVVSDLQLERPGSNPRTHARAVPAYLSVFVSAWTIR